MENINFDGIKDAIDTFTQLIKDFTAMLKAFIDSWKKEVKFEA